MTDPIDPNAQPDDSAEPTGTLLAAAGAALEESIAPRATLAAELTPEQMAQVERHTQQAIDGAQRKWAEKRDAELQSGQYATPAQVEAKVAAAMQHAELKAKAEANVKLWLRDNGIQPGSEDEKKVTEEFTRGLKTGEYTNNTVLGKGGVGAIVYAAGLAPQAAPVDPMIALQRHPVSVSQPGAVFVKDDGKKLTFAEGQAQIRANNLKALAEAKG